jgi:thiosulfate dehydrogenase [quinone] large subunit
MLAKDLSKYEDKLLQKGETGMKTSSIVIIVIAAALGIFFGLGIGSAPPNWLAAAILAVIAAAGAYLVTSRYDAAIAIGTSNGTENLVEEPKLARFLFRDTRSAALWLPLRLFVGWSWLDAGWHKFNDPKWMDTGSALQGFWKSAVTAPPGGHSPISYDWWRNFIQTLLDNGAYTWFAKVITFGELLIGLGLITGTLVGVAAFSGTVMNMSFMLSGSTSSNPILFGSAILLVLGWKVAGWIGLDRFVLPLLGTPWQKGVLLGGQKPPQVAPSKAS